MWKSYFSDNLPQTHIRGQGDISSDVFKYAYQTHSCNFFHDVFTTYVKESKFTKYVHTDKLITSKKYFTNLKKNVLYHNFLWERVM